MADRLIYARGALHAVDRSWLTYEEDVLSTREGVFETLLVADRKARDQAAHVDRLLEGVESLGGSLRGRDAQLLDAISEVASVAPTPWARMRVTAFACAGELELLVSAVPYVPPLPTVYARGVHVTLARNSRIRRADESRQTKSLAWRRRGEALLAAVPGSYEVLLLNDAGRLAEGARTNLVVRRAGIAVTPALSEGCLPGTVRNRLVESGAVRQGELDVADTLTGGEVALTNSLVGVVPVARIDDMRCEVISLASELRTLWEEAQS